MARCSRLDDARMAWGSAAAVAGSAATGGTYGRAVASWGEPVLVVPGDRRCLCCLSVRSMRRPSKIWVLSAPGSR